MLTMAYKGEEGVRIPPFLADIICEQTLTCDMQCNGWQYPSWGWLVGGSVGGKNAYLEAIFVVAL